MVLYPNKLPESERVCSGICTHHNIFAFLSIVLILSLIHSICSFRHNPFPCFFPSISFLVEYPVVNCITGIERSICLLKVPSFFRHIVCSIDHTIEFYLLTIVTHKFLFILQSTSYRIHLTFTKIKYNFEPRR